jgi:SOS response regulatory protein OraA/RecX
MTLDIYLPEFDISVPNPPKRKPPKIFVPYTYWLYLIPEDLYYYGVKYGNSEDNIAHPLGFWNNYHTSSAIVEEWRNQYDDEKDWRFQIHRIFYTAQAARIFEDYVLTQHDAKMNDFFINDSNGRGDRRCSGPKSSAFQRAKNNLYDFYDEIIAIWAEPLTRPTKPKLAEIYSEKCGREITEWAIGNLLSAAWRAGDLKKMNSRQSMRSQNILYDSENYDKICDMKTKGTKTKDIAKVMSELLDMEIERKDIETIILSGKKEGKIPQMTYLEARRNNNPLYKDENYQMILELRRRGYSQPKIARGMSTMLKTEITDVMIQSVLQSAKKFGDF